jgi:hypothetical protein
MHRPPLDSFRQLNLLRHLSAGFTGLHTEFGLCMPEYQGRRFRALLLHSTSRIISSQNLLKQRCAPPFQRRTSRTVIVHGLLEVDGIEDLDAVRLINDLAVFILHGLSVLPQFGCAPLEHFSALHQNGSLRVVPVKIENRSVTYNFRLRNYLLSHHHASAASSCPPRCLCSLC